MNVKISSSRGSLQTIYLDNAAASAPPSEVIDAMSQYLELTSTIGPYEPIFRANTYAQIAEIRSKTAGFLGANPTEISFTKNGSEAISIIAQGVQWQPGDEIIISDNEMLSNLVPWLAIQQTKGVKIVTVATDEQTLIQPAVLESLLTSRTRLVSITHVSNSTGAIQDLAALCRLLKARGVEVLVNAAESIGLVPIDVRELNIDYLAACGRKALRGPEGSGVLFVRDELRAQVIPPLLGWWNCDYDAQTGAFSIHTDGTRFEAGCPITPSILGLGAAIDYATSVGIDNIYSQAKQLAAYTANQLKTVPGLQIYGPHPENQIYAIVFNVQGVDPTDIASALASNNVVIEAGTFNAFPILKRYNIKKMARISPHYFNTTQEIDEAVALIKGMH